MFGRITPFLREQLGSDRVSMIFAETDGKNLLLYPNVHLNGYGKVTELGYSKTIPFSNIGPEQLAALKGKDSRFYSFWRRFTKTTPEGSFTLIERSIPDAADEIISPDGGCYAFHPSDKLAERIGNKGTGFSNDGLMIHEGAHGVIYTVLDSLEELFGVDVRNVEETISQLVGLKYLERYNTEEAKRYVAEIEKAETDDIHMGAFDMVLNQRSGVEEMAGIIRLLNSQ
jgi:hypothetical protein